VELFQFSYHHDFKHKAIQSVMLNTSRGLINIKLTHGLSFILNQTLYIF
jgi:hypothetical protein